MTQEEYEQFKKDLNNSIKKDIDCIYLCLKEIVLNPDSKESIEIKKIITAIDKYEKEVMFGSIKNNNNFPGLESYL